eukprot:TRINITY_DN807_c0_g1_i9.p1 TRINITY_DN807_c0_g1~~TRINITY_DN807_c0_g1_i9.p1  ORF type:complete len:295 (+),score=-3.16 TRINITY_DN807_c0_g1_i9:928-1812(+)
MSLSLQPRTRTLKHLTGSTNCITGTIACMEDVEHPWSCGNLIFLHRYSSSSDHCRQPQNLAKLLTLTCLTNVCFTHNLEEVSGYCKFMPIITLVEPLTYRKMYYYFPLSVIIQEITTIKVTKDGNQEDVVLVGTKSGRIKIYGLPSQNKRGMIAAHEKVIGFLAWAGDCFMSVGSEGKIHVWVWQKGTASSGFGSAPGGGFGRPPSGGFGGAPGGGFGGPSSGGFGGAPGGGFGGPSSGGQVADLEVLQQVVLEGLQVAVSVALQVAEWAIKCQDPEWDINSMIIHPTFPNNYF